MIDDMDAVRAVTPGAYTVIEWLPPEGERAALVRFFGEIDLGTAPMLEDAVLRQTERAVAVVIDLTTVAFLDSAGVRLLDGLVGAFDERGIRVCLVAPPQSVARFTLRLCAFRNDLIEPTLKDARAALS